MESRLVTVLMWLLFPKIPHVGMEKSEDRISSHTRLQEKPNITSWELDSHYLVVNWKYSQNERLQGYYVLLCQLVNLKCNGPDFVHFSNKARSGRIVGLAPEAVYRMEVKNM